MKITHVRIRRLETGPHFSNRAVEMEALLEDGENYAEVAAELEAKVMAQLRGAQELDRLLEDRDALREAVFTLEKRRDVLRAEIEAGRKVIREHAQLADVARERGMDVMDKLHPEIPF